MNGIGVTDSGVQIWVTNLQVWIDAAQKRSYSGTGAFWNDLSANIGFADLYNTPTFSTNNGGYFTFSNNSYANANTAATYSTWTVSVWVKIVDAQLGGQYRVMVGNQTLNGQGILYVPPTGSSGSFFNYWGWYGDDGGGGNISILAENAIGTDTWNNLSVTYNSGSGYYKFYRNGNYITQSNLAASTNWSSYYVGRNSNNQNPFPGIIANVLIYNTDLTEAQHTQNFKAIKSRFGL